jgi:hypothetical protein
MQRPQLQALSREELIREAERAGVPRPRTLTQAELVDEILKRTAGGDTKRARGLLGRARDLIATVVEKGLHLPDAAAAIRGAGPRGWPPPPPPLPTVTLAEIYAAQGHLERAVAVLDEVLAREPDHQEARELRERFQAQLARGPKGASEPPAKSESLADEAEEAPEDQEEAPHAAPAGPSLPETTQRSREEPTVLDPASAGPTAPVVVVADRDTQETLSAPRIEDTSLTAPTSRDELASTEPAPAPSTEVAAVTAPSHALPPTEPASEARAALEQRQDQAAEAAAGAPVAQEQRSVRAAEAAVETPVAQEQRSVRAAEAAIGAPVAQEQRQEQALEAMADTVAAAAESAATESAVAQAAAAEAAATEAAAAEAAATAAAPAALPERYDVDEVVALAVDPSTFYVYWEVRPTTFAHMEAQAPGGVLALRVIAVTPGWDGPIVETRDVQIDALHGDHFIHHVRPRADVRVSIGWVKDGRFDPIAVGAEVSAPSAFVAAGAPARGGAPLDLSEGLHGGRVAGPGSFARPVAFESRLRPAQRIAAGWLPRDLLGATMEGETAQAPEGAGAAASWIWVPGPGAEAASVPITFGPSEAARGPVRAPGAPAPSWGGASEGGPHWGGASEGVTRWGGASEASPR